MKQLPMTPELSKLIKDRVGEDVDTANLTVFEVIALNTKPLPGKRGSIFEKAVVKPVTLAQMVDHIISGGHLPLVSNHDLSQTPRGRFFHAALHSDDNSLEELEMRGLFYLDSTEEEMIAKLDAGSMDEVSVSFLSSAFLCSECGFDYFSQGTPENFSTKTCNEGHTIGEDGVHAELVGLAEFLELSLVARGAADKPKILGKSQSKLAPESAYRLAAKGFETDALVVHASMGSEEDIIVDTTKLVSDFADTTAKLAVADSNVARLTSERADFETKLTAETARADQLELDLAAAKAELPEDYETGKTELAAAKSLLQSQFTALTVATGGEKPEDDKLPTEIAALEAGINEMTGKLTALLPIDGKSVAAGSDTNGRDKSKVDLSGFKTAK